MIRIPGYIIKREIGSGGMAAVYLAVQTSLERKVALKVMAPALVADQTFSKRFLREARTVAGLSHPNIVAIYDVGITKNQLHYFSMQHLNHGDLTSRILQGITERELIRILSGICEALYYAHGRGFVHRDVTPGNILFDASGTPVLTDFGIARAVTQSTKITGTGVSVGTSHYMSPEQARGRDVDPRSDIYSLGAIVYEALAGRPAYDGEDGFAIAYSHVFDPIPTLPNRFARWQPFIDKAMAKKPEDRFDSAREVAVVMNELLNTTTGEGRKPPPTLTLPGAEKDIVETEPMLDIATRVSESESGQQAAQAGRFGRGWTRLCDQLFGFLPAAQRRLAGTVSLFGLLALATVAVFQGGRSVDPSAGATSSEAVANRSDEAIQAASDVAPPNGQAPAGAAQSEQPIAAADDGEGPVATDDAGAANDDPLDSDLPALDDGDETAASLAESDAPSEPVPETSVLSGPAQIAALLNRAESQFTANLLTSPEGNNALETYQEVLALDSANQSARAGTERVIDRYIALVSRAVERKQYAQATELLARADGIRDRVAGLNPELLQQVDTAQELVFEHVFSAARTATAAGQLDQAAGLLDSALRLQPNNSEAIAARAELRTQNLSLARPGGAPAATALRDPLASGGFGPELVRVDLDSYVVGNEQTAVQVGPAAQIGVGATEVTVAQYRQFVEVSGYGEGRRSGCRNLESAWRSSRSRTWLAPGFEQGDDHPVSCVSWQSAVDYVEWLSAETGFSYRLLNETEWDYLYSRSRSAGFADSQYCESGNVADRWLKTQLPGAAALDCEDGWAYTAPVHNYPANLDGLYGLIGNVREWVADCWSKTRNVRDYRADLTGDCGDRVVKGTAWLHHQPQEVDNGIRRAFAASAGFNTVGFRVARALD